MSINFENLLLRLSPVAPLDFGSFSGNSIERERMKLLREQFEEQKRQNAEDEKWRRESEAGEMARARLALQKQREAAEQEAAAKLMLTKQEAYRKFSELNAGGDIEGARAMVPYMTSLGMGVDLEGEAAGLPRYAIHMDAEQADREQSASAAQTSPYGAAETAEQSLSRLEGMGYPTNESGALEDPGATGRQPATGPVGTTDMVRIDGEPEPLSPDVLEATGDAPSGMPASTLLAGDAYAQALRAGEYARQTGRPIRDPDEEDYTGSVPQNVIDMGALQAQTLARLHPVLSAFTDSYPEQYRESAARTAEGVAALGLPAAKAVETFQSMRRSPDSLIQADIAASAQAGDRANRRSANERKAAQSLIVTGTKFAKQIGAEYDVKGAISRQKPISQGLAALRNDDDADDHLVGSLVSRLMGERGATTEGDIKRALGTSAMSFIDRVKTNLFQEAFGGLTATQKNALAGVLERAAEEDGKIVDNYLANIDEQIASPDTDPDVARGMRSYRDALVPREWRQRYDEARRKDKGSGMQAGSTPRATSATSAQRGQPLAEMGDFDLELEGQALESGLDPEAIRRVIALESGGRADAVNDQSGATGLIQFMPETAKGLGVSAEKLRGMSAAEQLPLVMRYFENAGLDEDSTPDDYAVAVAAPSAVGKPDDTIVYPKGSSAWEQNPAWRSAGGGDITVGSIKAAYRRKGSSSRIKQLLDKGGY